MVAGVAADRRTPASRCALVARGRHVLEIDAAGALQQVAGGRREVAQLPRRPGEQGLGQHRVVPADRRVGGKVAVAHPRPDPHAALRQRLDLVERQPGHVDKQVGARDAELHVVDEVGAGAEKRRTRAARDPRHGTRGVGGALVFKRVHDAAAARIAATMLT